jgi:hypothetical protein
MPLPTVRPLEGNERPHGGHRAKWDCVVGCTRWRMNLSGARAHRTEHLARDSEHDGDKTRLVRARQRAIGRELRRLYDGVVNEPVPD